MSTYETWRMLQRVHDSLIRYDGPLGIMGDTPDGIEDDIYIALVKIREQIEVRMSERKREAV